MQTNKPLKKLAFEEIPLSSCTLLIKLADGSIGNRRLDEVLVFRGNLEPKRGEEDLSLLQAIVVLKTEGDTISLLCTPDDQFAAVVDALEKGRSEMM
jgi:hypothetical protein